jgi:hypothetical protein
VLVSRCHFAHEGDDGKPVRCPASAEFEVRWRWADGTPDNGTMCLLHIFIACQQLAEDPDIEADSVQLRRREVTDN